MTTTTIGKEKAISAAHAAGLVNSGDSVVLGGGAALPQRFVEALVVRADELRDVRITHSRVLGEVPYLKAEYRESFRHNTFLVYGEARDAVARGRADYTPCFLSRVPALFRNKDIRADIAVAQLSPPDEDGYCSYSTYHFYLDAARKAARIFVAEINEQAPRTCSQERVPIGEVDYVIEASYPLPELQEPRISEVEERIGANVAELVEDGSTLQLGAGSIPDAIARFLVDKRQLGLHSELVSDGVIDLLERGVIDNSQKAVATGRSIVSFVFGTKRLYDYLDGNTSVEFRPIDFTNDPLVIGRNPKVVAVNSALQVDLTGQVNSESLGTRQLSGVGGQIDFARGAARSPGGKFIIALPSTAKGGSISRMVPTMSSGTAVTTTRADVDYVVTEFGVAHLRGKCMGDRARALINIVHPGFREELERRFKELV